MLATHTMKNLFGDIAMHIDSRIEKGGLSTRQNSTMVWNNQDR